MLAIVTDQLLHKGIGQKHHVDEHQTHPRDLVQPETEQSQDGQDHEEEEQEDEPKLDMRDDCILSMVIGDLRGSMHKMNRRGSESE